MKKILKKLGVVVLSFFMMLSTSCKKDNPSTPGGGSGFGGVDLIASADLNFVDDGDTHSFKCYQKVSYNVETIIMIDDESSQLLCTFLSTDNDGTPIEGAPKVTINIEKLNDLTGFHVGEVFDLANHQTNDYSITVMVDKRGESMEPNYSYLGINDSSDEVNGTGQLKITKMSGKHLQADFNFNLKSGVFGPPDKHVIVSNGKINNQNIQKFIE